MMISRILLTAALAALMSSGAFAQGAAKPTLVGTFNDWTMWSYTGSYSGNGSPELIHDRALLERLARFAGPLVRVPGSWRDF